MKSCVKCGGTAGAGLTQKSGYCQRCKVLLGFVSRTEVGLHEDLQQYGGLLDNWRRRQLAEGIPYRLLKVQYWPEVYETSAELSRSPRYDATIQYFLTVC